MGSIPLYDLHGRKSTESTNLVSAQGTADILQSTELGP